MNVVPSFNWALYSWGRPDPFEHLPQQPTSNLDSMPPLQPSIHKYYAS